MAFTLTFLKVFLAILYLISPILLALCTAIVILGIIVGRHENWSRFNSVYWTFITAFTVGYGDFRPSKKLSKILAIAIAWLGVMFSGVIVAVTVASTTTAFKAHINPAALEKMEQQLDVPKADHTVNLE
ncbi:MAG: potassium channel family protein [Halioglobus sp.]